MSDVEAFDYWFNLTKDEESIKAWNAAKSVYSDENALIRWARIIEFNRLDRMIEKGKNEQAQYGARL